MSIDYLLPDEHDNVAIAARRLEAGAPVEIGGETVVLGTTVPKGHRLAVSTIAAGDPVLSWGYPFGFASTAIAPGDYLCNAKMRDVLQLRDPQDYPHGLKVNFVDRDTTAEQTIPESSFPVEAERQCVNDHTFQGFHRGPHRGWGTRNDIAIIGVTSHSRGLVLAAADELQEAAAGYANVDAVTPVAHTEGGNSESLQNRELVVRTLAGFAVNPNVGAAVFVNYPDSPVSNAELLSQLQAMGPRYFESTVRFFLADDDFDGSVSALTSLVGPLLGAADRHQRTTAPLSGLKLGLQCGGSDAFSGVTANPLLGAAVEKVLQNGGAANLAETDELIGAEEHVLARTRRPELVTQFLDKQNAFKHYAQRHGTTAEGNVSGGNIYRGLYNITLKSLGAGRKKAHDTVLDHVIGYGEPMDAPGYYFMDSPGNDLESVAGQVAAGANIILFTTGNGSITNFPFVPTIKIVTTTERYELLESDMDFNAGSLLDGKPFGAARDELFELIRETASGTPSKGELTGQAQVQIWRNWHRTLTGEDLPFEVVEPDGDPLLTIPDAPAQGAGFSGPGAPTVLGRQILQILPTSLCSGQVAEKVAAKVNRSFTELGCDDRWKAVALPHTEGCGVAGGDAEAIYTRTMIGYATHPAISHTVFLEHGCEKTHNDYFREQISSNGADPSAFDWTSIQRTGGIDAVTAIINESAVSLAKNDEDGGQAVPDSGFGTDARPRVIRSVGLASIGTCDARKAEAAAETVRALLAAGISPILSETDPLLRTQAFLRSLDIQDPHPTIGSGARPRSAGLHVMQSSSSDWLENATGIGAAGALALLTFADARPAQPHRLLPVVQVGRTGGDKEARQFDLLDDGTDISTLTQQILVRLDETVRGEYQPKIQPRPNVGFQLSRGFSGVSV